MSAETAFSRAVKLAPDDPLIHNNLGALLRARGELEAASQAFQRAVALAPDWPLAQTNLGLMLALLGRPEDAAGHYARAVELDSAFPDSYFHRLWFVGQVHRWTTDTKR